MKFFVDTANLDQIREAHAMGVLDGVTTNPSLMARENIRGEEACRRHYVEICRIVQGDVSAEVIATDFEGMVREGESLAALDPHIVVKRLSDLRFQDAGAGRFDPPHAPHHPVPRCRGRRGDLPAGRDQGSAQTSADGERPGAVPGRPCAGERLTGAGCAGGTDLKGFRPLFVEKIGAGVAFRSFVSSYG